jgi:dTMP kinase
VTSPGDTRRGLFLAVEGVEGSGKSTQLRLLAEALRRAGHEVTVAREPGGTPLGERVREVVLGDATLEVPAWSEVFLMLAARRAFVEQVVRPAVESGGVMVADRFELSTFAYQGGGRGLPIESLRSVNRHATGGTRPDLTLYLEIDPAEGASRQRAAGKRADRMETEAEAFHQRVAEAYAALAAEAADVVPIDAHGSPAEVHGRMVGAIEDRFPGTFTSGRGYEDLFNSTQQRPRPGHKEAE